MTYTQCVTESTSRLGSRRSTSAVRQQRAVSEAFDGLPEAIDKYDLLNAAKRCGKAAGFSPVLLQFLEYLINHTQDQDWRGGCPIVYKSVTRMARDFGITERQVRNWEKKLFTLGVLTWKDSANHRRTGLRDTRTGQLIFAYGVDLSPLADHQQRLEAIAEQLAAEEVQWRRIKIEIGHEKREIRALLAEASPTLDPAVALTDYHARLEALSKPIMATTPLPALEQLLPRLRALRERLEHHLAEADSSSDPMPESDKNSGRAEENFRHFNTTTTKLFRRKSNPPDSCSARKQGRRLTPCQETSSSAGFKTGTGIEHLTLRQVLSIVPEGIADTLRGLTNNPYTWNDLIEAAHWQCQPLGINQSAWTEACAEMGRAAAAVCVVLADRGREREENPIHSPGGYLRAMTDRARVGELHLHRSVFGWLQKDYDHG